ncbi:MAG: metallopeptidase family protein [Gordonia sp. (in: high G+C Gram-positive bacteria)]|uniref:metallopeptidase family protein n=1 Tax=Gordonia sp. (in: high G+C Gram-positive bacteria) TaxID=84139 RepID=UPI0039E21965
MRRQTMRTRRARDRRARGLRSPLLPQTVPAWTSRSDEFDTVVIEVLAEIDRRWHDQLLELNIAVDDVPRMLPHDPASVQWPAEVSADRAIPLARLIPAGIDTAGNATPAQIVVFRRPLEVRAKGRDDLAELVREVLVEQVATYLGIDEDTVENGPA